MTDAAEVNLKKDLVLYIDLMGFKNVLASADGSKKASILRLLTELKAQDANAQFERKQTGERSWQMKMTPAITAFSDNIVLSFPGTNIEHVNMMGVAVARMAYTAAHIADQALAVGCLIRGGLALGELSHQNGVVFGTGLVEAYKLESTCAHYPRVVVAPAILDRASSSHTVLRRDHDGMDTLDYISCAFNGTAPEVLEKLSKWERQISAMMSSFDERTPLRTKQNWNWFRNSVAAFAEIERPRLIAAINSGEK